MNVLEEEEDADEDEIPPPNAPPPTAPPPPPPAAAPAAPAPPPVNAFAVAAAVAAEATEGVVKVDAIGTPALRQTASDSYHFHWYNKPVEVTARSEECIAEIEVKRVS